MTLRVEELDLNEEGFVEKNFLKLLIQSFNYDCKQNDFKPINSLEGLKTALGTDKIYIVNRQDKFIGFFVNPISSLNRDVSIKIFRYPMACPMSSRSLMKCAFLRAVGFYLKGEVDKVEFNVWHAAFTHVVKSIIPTVNLHSITSDYIICFHEFQEDMKSKYILILSRYMDQDLVNNEIELNNFDVVL